LTPEISVSHPCGAKTIDKETGTKSGPPCRRPVKPGDIHCSFHGGKIPRVRNAAQVRKNQLQAQYQVRKRIMLAGGHATMDDAYAELEQLAAEAAIFRQVCFERLEALKVEDWRYAGKTGEQLRSEVALYERAMDRSQKYLMDYAKLGIAEKRVKIAEAQAMILVGVIQNVLGRLDLSRDQKRIAATVVPEELRAIAAPAQKEPAP
jgi:chaperonin cofactor prefoldin